jgi:hypothetical protein
MTADTALIVERMKVAVGNKVNNKQEQCILVLQVTDKTTGMSKKMNSEGYDESRKLGPTVLVEVQ